MSAGQPEEDAITWGSDELPMEDMSRPDGEQHVAIGSSDIQSRLSDDWGPIRNELGGRSQEVAYRWIVVSTLNKP